MTTTPADLFGARAGDHVALVVDGERELSVADWTARSQELAGRLAPVRTALRHDDWIEHAVAALAVHLAGGTVLGLPPALPEKEVRARLAECGVGQVLPGPIGDPAGGRNNSRNSARNGARDDSSDDHVAEILYTSGTTGRPKAVAVPVANLTYGHEGRGKLFTGVDGVLAAVPLGTNAGHSALMTAMTAPATTHVLTDLGPENVARMLQKLRVPMAIVPPSTATRMVAHGWHERFDLSGLRALMLGSAPVPMATVARLMAALPGVRIVIGYGSTESAPAFVHRPVETPPTEADEGLLGRPSAGTEVKITEAGEICLRSDAPPRYYLNDAAAGERTFRDGWTHMGDLGDLDGAGRLRFFDRAADVITSDGRRVSSLRVEHALHWHPEVIEAAAFEGPQGLTAAVVLRSPVPESELSAFAADRLEPAERPARYVVTETLPRGPIGKTLKRVLARTAG
ncbi:class I adenylate-forming enzyme family protein [Nonomuraea cavernae]|uniref:class I adenylate-forming enzyme family protein n=1 Tax=Nonomuraea cavernae TaxID=2045107 RepID=UPI0033C0E8BC